MRGVARVSVQVVREPERPVQAQWGRLRVDAVEGGGKSAKTLSSAFLEALAGAVPLCR
jgi:hypothetical protein